PRPPTSPLFPYTTLFRSDPQGEHMAVLDTAADKRRGVSRQRAVEEHHDLFARLRATVGLVANLGVPVRGQPLPLLLGDPGVAARRRPVAVLAHRLVEGRLGR